MATRPHSLAPHALTIAGWIAFAVAGALFFALAWNVASAAPLVELDSRVTAWLFAHHTPGLTRAMLFITHANSTVAVAALGIVFAAVLYRMGEKYWILTLALALGGGQLLNVALKHAYERARPHFDDPVLTLSSFSFPSGHTAGATLFYGVLAAFLVTRFFDPRIRAACVAGALLAIALVAFSRVYLGAHYLSDVLAAACSSIAWLVLCLSSVHALVRQRMRAQARA